MTRRKALRREEREIMVINWFAIRIQYDNEEYASMSEIAKEIGISPSSHLRKILSNMVENRTLDERKLIRPGRWDGRGYMLVSGSFQRPQKQTIRLSFTQNGIKQLELI